MDIEKVKVTDITNEFRAYGSKTMLAVDKPYIKSAIRQRAITSDDIFYDYLREAYPIANGTYYELLILKGNKYNPDSYKMGYKTAFMAVEPIMP